MACCIIYIYVGLVGNTFILDVFVHARLVFVRQSCQACVCKTFMLGVYVCKNVRKAYVYDIFL